MEKQGSKLVRAGFEPATNRLTDQLHEKTLRLETYKK
jgi:hypothetical protein